MIHCFFRIRQIWLSRPWINYESSFSRSDHESTIYFVNSLVHYIQDLSMNSVIILQINHKCTVCLANSQCNSVNSLWIHCLLYEFVLGSYSKFIREFIIKALGVSSIYFEVIILFTNILWLNFLYQEFTMNSPTVSRLHSLFCEYTKNSLFVLWTHYGSITFFANLLSFSLSKVVSRSSRARPSPKSKINRKKLLLSLNICILHKIAPNSPNWLF